MTRPAYETATHRAAQAKLARALERHFGIKLKPLKNAHYSLDYFACDAKTRVGRGWVELKCRNTRWGQYDAVMISAGKWRDGVTLAESTGLPFGLWFEFADGSVHGYVYDPKHVGSPHDQTVRAQADTTKLLLPYGQQEVDKNGLWSDGKLWVRPGVWLEWGGRTSDERDDADAEPVVMIANSLWEPLALDRSELEPVPPKGDPAPKQPRVDDASGGVCPFCGASVSRTDDVCAQCMGALPLRDDDNVSKEAQPRTDWSALKDPEPPAPHDDYPF